MPRKIFVKGSRYGARKNFVAADVAPRPHERAFSSASLIEILEAGVGLEPA